MAKKTKAQTVLYLADFHLPYYDEAAFDVMIEYVDENYIIDKVILGGGLDGLLSNLKVSQK